MVEGAVDHERQVERGMPLNVVRDGVLVIFHKDLVDRGEQEADRIGGRVQLGNMKG